MGVLGKVKIDRKQTIDDLVKELDGMDLLELSQLVLSYRIEIIRLREELNNDKEKWHSCGYCSTT